MSKKICFDFRFPNWLAIACQMFVVTVLLPFEIAQAQTAKHAVKNTARLDIDFTATDLDGKPFDAKSLHGKIVLLDFWAVWCAPCIAAFPTLNRLHKDFKDQNFEVVGIAVYSGKPASVRKFLKKHDLQYQVVVGDADLSGRFNVIGFPTYFLIGPKGRIVKKYVGEVKDLYRDVKADILKLTNKESKQ
ncbi:MAG: TlpA disulfide reductase family protein [bacterium]